MSFINALARRYPNKKIYVVWDNLNIHYDGKDDRWRRFHARHGQRFRFVYTPIKHFGHRRDSLNGYGVSSTPDQNICWRSLYSLHSERPAGGEPHAERGSAAQPEPPHKPTAPEPTPSSPKARPLRVLAQVYSSWQKAIANPERSSDREDSSHARNSAESAEFFVVCRNRGIVPM